MLNILSYNKFIDVFKCRNNEIKNLKQSNRDNVLKRSLA